MENKVYTYKYMWHVKGLPDTLRFRFVCGIQAEHDDFLRSIQADDDIEKCCRVYVNEIDCDKADKMEFIKGVEDDEKAE